MLVLSRNANEKILIGNDIVITVLRVKGEQVRIGINAPAHIPIVRSELTEDDDDSKEAKQ